jgi:hypothetical protein
MVKTVENEPIMGPFSDKPPSDIFLSSITFDGGIEQMCDFCGRTFFEDDEKAGDWEPGELEGLRQKAITDPDRYRGVARIRRMTFGAQVGVVGCPCNALRKAEDLFWKNRKSIMAYISARVKDIVEHALEDEGLSDQATADLVQEEKASNTVECKKCQKLVSQISITDDGMCVRCKELDETGLVDCPVCKKKIYANSMAMTAWGMCEECHKLNTVEYKKFLSCVDEDLLEDDVINCKICKQPMWRDSNEMTQWGICQKCHDAEEEGLPF